MYRHGAGDNLALSELLVGGHGTWPSGQPCRPPRSFASLGTSLLLHTLVPLPALFAAAVFPSARPVTAYNVSIIVAVVLNGICAYASAYFLTRDRLASLFAGITFAVRHS